MVLSATKRVYLLFVRFSAEISLEFHFLISYISQVCAEPPSPPQSEDVQNFVVIENVTEAMLKGVFWTYSDFYNHTGEAIIVSFLLIFVTFH